MNNCLLITVQLRVCIIFALEQLFSKHNPGLTLELFFEMTESVSDGMKLCSNKRGFSRYGNVRNRRYD